jgi:glycosyltransferase involved in cell wall biosynthesis
MMRPVLLVCLSRGFGGAEARIHAVATALHGVRPYAVATLDGSPLARRLAAHGLNVLPVGRSRTDPRLLLRLARIIRGRSIEAVDAHNPQSQLWALGAAWLARVPVMVSTVHSVYANTAGGWWKPWLYVGVLRLNRFWDCRFVAISGEIMESLLRIGVPPGRIIRSPNGIAANWAVQADPGGMRAELGWKSAAIIAIIGRLIPEKGHSLLLHAVARLRTRYPEARCLIVGDGPLRARLQILAAELGLSEIVRFAGFRTEIAEILLASDVACVPSLTEGLPYVALEAACLARPLVLSAVGELPAYFTHSATARMVRPGNVDDLVREIGWCLALPAEARRMGEAARDMVRERLSPDRMLADTLAVYDP